ncbi:putative glycosyltransferase involved in capsule biosynthesis [Acinetobacter calcoaceticus]|uniref:Putative glycosyltransferase involved in capsule biosynthesis n=1 Tax=Acinetobacter calcoaceticus TaxID=471 RepID=A0A4R1Y0T6_ACICA|nr:putative glycosyltransferase involved in capsule biosynthesis [Acinetobacter calcoaceticus]
MNPHAPTNIDLSIIVPIDLSRRSKEIYSRALGLARRFDGTGIKLIFGCSVQPARWFTKLSKALSAYSHVRIAAVDQSESHLAKLRNVALAQVTTTYVMFLDVDIYPELTQIQQALSEVCQSPHQMCMYPCLYLSARGSKKLGRVPVTDFRDYYYQFKREWILHLAFPSSIIICDMKSVNEIKGFDPLYVGHGYEDFDFMIRLFLHKQLISPQPKLHIDEPYMAPLMATGFRAMLAQAQLQQLLGQLYFVHDYHGKDKQENYYQLRAKNQTRFKQKMVELEQNTISEYQSNPLELLSEFFTLLSQHKKIPSEYSALWAEIPGHLFRRKWF